MLDTETKRRIDTARDILVGKVPDPKSQVEQITIALIYKFMDDMDAESEDLGGARSFFAGEFAKYGWANLMAVGLQAQDTLRLYEEGIDRIPQNPGIPELFRDIFKNAYLPYRDPATLKSFLKVIDEFTYDHSEKLGDAFEYLLSVLGSQGDAGQFRTPRHIIDFMVAIMDPKKDETILDPACGTAGFLISAYKHILKANQDEKGQSTLTPDDKAKLAKNFLGYDISPDMVRLSLVNLYLHGFKDPHIHEYDTLTSEERWNENADVILANPPFMSPKGGIKPHKRFSIDAKRSEVLFVDYMAEHLTPNGRAAIIVPEGIIFQSQGAYKDLRKLLVEKYLVAVVSLPAGCFNPYSGVKTSILILDKSLAAKSDTIAFFKVENDGFGLGAQRRVIIKDDLPLVGAELYTYMQILGLEQPVDELKLVNGLVVPKVKVIANIDYNLSGERYREGEATNNQYPQVALGTICKPVYGFTASAEDNGDARFVRITDIAPNGRLRKDECKFITLTPESEAYLLEKGDLLVARTGATYGKTMLFNEDYPAVFASYLIRLRFPPDQILPEFYWSFAQSEKYWEQASSLASGGGQPQFNGNALVNIKIPMPPLEIQKEIVAEIEGYQKIIDGARAVLDNYRPHIPIHPDWPMVALGQHFTTSSGGTPSKDNLGYWIGDIPWVSPKDMKSDVIVDTEDHISQGAVKGSATKLFPAKTVVCVVRSGILKHTFPIALLSRPMCINQDLIAFQPKGNSISSEFLFYVLKTRSASILNDGIKPGVTVQSFYNGFFKDYQIPIPPFPIQQSIVAEIEAEQALVAGNRELITRFEKKIQATLARIWAQDDDIEQTL